MAGLNSENSPERFSPLTLGLHALQVMKRSAHNQKGTLEFATEDSGNLCSAVA